MFCVLCLECGTWGFSPGCAYVHLGVLKAVSCWVLRVFPPCLLFASLFVVWYGVRLWLGMSLGEGSCCLFVLGLRY